MAASPQDAITWWAVASAFGGSVLGGTISTIVAFVVQNRALKAAKAQRDEDRLEKRRASAYALLFKLIRLTSDLQTLGNAVRDCLSKAEHDGFRGAAWQIVLPVPNLPDPIKFNPEEMALVLSLSSDVFNKTVALDELHASTVAIFDAYATRRQAVLERFGAEMEGTLGTSKLKKEDVEWLSPRGVEMNMLIDAMLQRAEVDGKEAKEALVSIHALFEKELQLRVKLEFK